MDAKILTREIVIGGQKIPVWFIGAAVVIAAIAFLSASKNRTAQIATATDAGTTAQTNDNTAKTTDLESTLNGFASQLQDAQTQLAGALSAQSKSQSEYQTQLNAAQGDFQKQIAAALAAQRDDFAGQLASVRDAASRTQTAAVSSIGGASWDSPNYAAMQSAASPAPSAPRKTSPLQAIAAASPARDEKAFQAYRAGERESFGTAATGSRSALDLQRAGERGGSANYYTVIGGDTLFAIAKRNNTTVAALMAKNSQITNANKIRVGQTINL